MVFRTMSPDEIRYWYTEELSEAFAPNERKPLQDILMLQNEGRYELWGLFDATQIAGYATIWKAPGIALVLLDYLGVSKRLRNGGLGSAVTEWLNDNGYQKPVTRLGLPDNFVEHGTVEELREIVGLDKDSIRRSINIQ